MIVVTVELWPQGDERRKRHMGTARLVNDGTGDELVGNYRATFSKWGRPDDVWRRGSVSGFPRKRLGPWDLLCLLLVDAVGQRVTS